MRRAWLGVLAGVLISSGAMARGPWRAGEDNTAGWQLMSPQERIEHQARLREFNDYAACRAYVDAHHAGLVARARDQGLAIPRARRDACAHLLPDGARQP